MFLYFEFVKKKKKQLNNTGRLDFKISQGQGKISLHLDFNIKLNKEINKLLCQVDQFAKKFGLI